MNNHLILVNEHDEPIGEMEKLLVHQQGLLHRAFSIFIFNRSKQLLLQRRALDKYHSGGLWTNTCCSHPQVDESMEEVTQRRLLEEMGLQVDLEFVFRFQYKASFENGLTEHELDYVYVGFTDQQPHPNPTEVMEWKYIDLPALQEDLVAYPEKYTAWLAICFPVLLSHMQHGNLSNLTLQPI
jgi:isopentenyl-diphosphate delta-isomerase